jgi:hypothetical protein
MIYHSLNLRIPYYLSLITYHFSLSQFPIPNPQSPVPNPCISSSPYRPRCKSTAWLALMLNFPLRVQLAGPRPTIRQGEPISHFIFR